MKRTMLSMGLMLVALASGRAQSIGPSTINAAGGAATAGGNEFEWSVGELALVSTFTGTGIIVTQGVLQPWDMPSAVPAIELLNTLSVFPNPASSAVHLQYTAGNSGTLTYRLMDFMGRTNRTGALDVKPGTNTAEVNIASLANAVYMLEVTVVTGDQKPASANYKIEKLY